MGFIIGLFQHLIVLKWTCWNFCVQELAGLSVATSIAEASFVLAFTFGRNGWNLVVGESELYFW